MSLRPSGSMRRRFKFSEPAMFLAPAFLWKASMPHAYHLKNFQVSMPASSSAPDTYYDVVARLKARVQSREIGSKRCCVRLLSDRLKLRAHRELREMPVYALVVGNSGPKFRASAPVHLPWVGPLWTKRDLPGRTTSNWRQHLVTAVSLLPFNSNWGCSLNRKGPASRFLL